MYAATALGSTGLGRAASLHDSANVLCATPAIAAEHKAYVSLWRRNGPQRAMVRCTRCPALHSRMRFCITMSVKSSILPSPFTRTNTVQTTISAPMAMFLFLLFKPLSWSFMRHSLIPVSHSVPAQTRLHSFTQPSAVATPQIPPKSLYSASPSMLLPKLPTGPYSPIDILRRSTCLSP